MRGDDLVVTEPRRHADKRWVVGLVAFAVQAVAHGALVIVERFAGAGFMRHRFEAADPRHLRRPDEERV
jgi:hypothetical protein